MTELAGQRRGARPFTRRAGPWAISLLAHAGLIGLAFLVTWSVMRDDERLPSPVVTGHIEQMTPIVTLRDVPPSSDIPRQIPAMTSVRTVSAPSAAPTVTSPPVSVPHVRPPATFAGAEIAGEGNVVFVIDTSGSMTPWLHFILDELERAMARLAPAQRCAVLCFAGDQVTQVPRRGLVDATGESRRAMVQALRRIRPGGRGGSDPVPALRRAIGLKPDQVVILSEGLDGAGRIAIDRDAVLEALEVLNPGRPGARPVRIDCIRLVTGDDQQPARLMDAIALRHGGGTLTRVTLEDLNR